MKDSLKEGYSMNPDHTPSADEYEKRKNAYSSYVPLLDASISNVLQTAIDLSGKNPSMIRVLLRLSKAARHASSLRRKNLSEGLVVPPVMIMSVTHRCNLKCKGCYAHQHIWEEKREMTSSQIDDILSQAEELGILFSIMAGGEPFSRKDLLEITSHHRSMIFPVFTNGLLITDTVIDALSNQRHVVPILSIEGDKEYTDNRRGKGVYEKIIECMENLSKRSINFGVSITINTENYDKICNESFIESLYDSGARVFFYIEYVAMEVGTESLELPKILREKLLAHIKLMKKRYPGIYVAFPGNEEQFGGCLSSGRGFVHINPSGGLEPCPAAPFTDINVVSTSLKEALDSPMLKVIRDNHDLLDESEGGCALWRNRHIVEALLCDATEYECTGRT